MKKALFFSIGMPQMSESQLGFYGELLRGITTEDFDLTVIAPSLQDGFSGMREEGIFHVLRVPSKPFVGNIVFFKKGIRILLLSYRYRKAYRKYLAKERFDYILMPTPPLALHSVVRMAKRRSNAKFYLLLRDILPECLDRKVIPQYVLDRTDTYAECLKPYGVHPAVEKLLYYMSQKLYRLADGVGCMSPDNQTYFKSIAPYVPEERILLLPNWYHGKEYSEENYDDLRERYDLKGKFIAFFGGTIGEAQAVWNIATLAKHNLSKKDVVFLVIGRGVKKKVLEEMARENHLDNIRFMDYVPQADYERLLGMSDVGLISIDEKYPVPTCPSRVVGYMAMAKPVLAMFNDGSDYGDFYIGRANCGLWSTHLDNEKMFENFDQLYADAELRRTMGMNGYHFYKEHLSVEVISQELVKQLRNV